MFSTPKSTPKPTNASIPKFSNEMLNNVPQVVTFGATDMPQDKLSNALAPRQFTATAAHVNKPTTEAVQTVLNTVHKISEKDEDKPKPSLFGATSTPLFGGKKTEGGLFGAKTDPVASTKPSLFAAPKADPVAPSKPSLFAPKAPTPAEEPKKDEMPKPNLFGGATKEPAKEMIDESNKRLKGQFQTKH